MNFWDSSAVVSLLVQEKSTADRLAQLEQNPSVLIWWATPVECASAVQRLVREASLTSAGADAAMARLRELENHWSEIEPVQQVRKQAERLLRVHPLRAADALQLAAALVAADFTPEEFCFHTADARLAEAAAKEGFDIR